MPGTFNSFLIWIIIFTKINTAIGSFNDSPYWGGENCDGACIGYAPAVQRHQTVSLSR